MRTPDAREARRQGGIRRDVTLTSQAGEMSYDTGVLPNGGEIVSPRRVIRLSVLSVLFLTTSTSACDWARPAWVAIRQKNEAEWHGYDVQLGPEFFLEEREAQLIIYLKATSQSSRRPSGPIVVTLKPAADFGRLVEWCHRNSARCESRTDAEGAPNIVCLDCNEAAALHPEGGYHGFYCRPEEGQAEAKFTCQDEGCQKLLSVVSEVFRNSISNRPE